MGTTYEIEPSTTATAWASSPLGEPGCESTESWDDGAERDTSAIKPTSIARHAAVLAALACGIGFGAALSLTVFDSTDATQPVVMVPRMDAPAVTPTGPAPALLEHHPAPQPGYQPSPEPIAPSSESAPVVEGGAPAAAEPPDAEVSSPQANWPSNPSFAPPSPGNPADTPVTVDVNVPQLPQPEPSDPQKPDPQIELGTETEYPVLTPQLPPKVALLPPKSRWTVNLPGQKPPKSTRGVPSPNRTRLNSVAKTGTAGDE